MCFSTKLFFTTGKQTTISFFVRNINNYLLLKVRNVNIVRKIHVMHIEEADNLCTKDSRKSPFSSELFAKYKCWKMYSDKPYSSIS